MLKPKKGIQGRNPPWSRNELILTLDLYRRHKGAPVGPNHADVIELSYLLNGISEATGDDRFRNPNGVAMKLMNFRSLDPVYTDSGGVGLRRIGKGDEAVWAEFADSPTELAVAADAIRSNTLIDTSGDALGDDIDDYSAEEGRIAYRLHRTRERSSVVVVKRKQAALKATGKLECEACDFDFSSKYGERGTGFIEAHHTKPVNEMIAGDVTRPEDLALLCANCHRMIHSIRPWLSIDELRALIIR